MGTTRRPIKSRAWARPIYAGQWGGKDSIDLVSSEQILGAPKEEQMLTLLHECIHMAFAFGEHRERWQGLKKRGRDAHAANMRDAGLDLERTGFLDYRTNLVFDFLTLPDEIVAEQRLKSDYPDSFDKRAAYYHRMRDGHTDQLRDEKPNDRLWPFVIFFELLRRAFFRSLVTETDRAAEFASLEIFAEERLKAWADADIPRSLLEMKSSLLDISVDRPLTEVEVAYEKLAEMVLTVEPTGG